MFKLQNFLKRYVWDPETTPYFTAISKLSRSQADNELFFFAIMFSVLFGVGTFTSITGQAPYGVSRWRQSTALRLSLLLFWWGRSKTFMQRIMQLVLP